MIKDWQPRSDFLKRLDAEAYAKGFEQGLQEARLEGARRLLLRQLRRRFGALPMEIEERVAAGSAEQVEGWADVVVYSDTLDAVFGG